MNYNKPELEIVVLEMVDVITFSAGDETKDDAEVPKNIVPENW